MAENDTTATNIQEPTAAAQEPTAVTPVTPSTAEKPVTQPQAVQHVDADAVVAQAAAKATEAAEKKMEAVFKSMLQQQGLDTSTINEMTKDWKEKHSTPEDTIRQLQGLVQAEQEKNATIQQQYQSELQAEREKTASFLQEGILRGHGLTDAEDISVFRIRINQLVTDEKPFEAAAKEYFEAHPRPTKVPASATFNGSGNTPIAEEKPKYVPPKIF